MATKKTRSKPRAAALERPPASSTSGRPTDGAPASGNATPVFTDEHLRLISESLPDAVNPRRLKLLPLVLREWGRSELREHMSRESAATIRQRARRMEAVAKHARNLLQALEALDDRDRTAIAVEMPRKGGDSWPKIKRHHWREASEIDGLIHRIRDENSFLASLVAAAPTAWTPWIAAADGKKRGPQSVTAYLIIKDAAAIFEWLTKTEIEATREVDRDSGEETGPFWRFLVEVWPVVFGDVRGLSSALKKWAPYREKERSALIANIAMRRSWRLFDV